MYGNKSPFDYPETAQIRKIYNYSQQHSLMKHFSISVNKCQQKV